jgi:hypothetical protein
MNPAHLRRARARFAGSLLLPCLALSSFGAGAQAWLPQKGSYSYSIDYSNTLNKKHYTPTGKEVDVGHTDINAMSLSGSYSPTDRISINASLPYVRTRYRGEGLGGHNTSIDDGTWHSTVTDLQFTVNYQLITGAFGLAPYVGAVIPTHDYTTFGHSAPGRGLNEYWVGTYAAVSLNEWIPRTYVQVRGNYSFVEKVMGISHDRINATLEVGYFFNPSWNVRVIASEQWTDGGINVPVPLNSPLFPVHDILADEEFVNVGAGGTWVINERMSVYGLYMEAIEGSNAHKVDHRMSIGFSYGVGPH